MEFKTLLFELITLIVIVQFTGVYGDRFDGCDPCKYSRCMPLNGTSCDYGFGRDHCECCDICLKGPGDACGGTKDQLGKCGIDLECHYERDKGTDKASGYCVKTSKCFKTKTCHHCQHEKHCKFGHGISRCAQGCCKICLKGKGDKCGTLHSDYVPCGEGLVCTGENINKHKYTPGKCVTLRRSHCLNKPDCRVGHCPKLPKKCPHGSATPECGCCPVCLKGPGETCSDYYGAYTPCGQNLRCVGQNPYPKPGKPYQPGKCVWQASKCPHKRDCLHGVCHLLPKCKYGLGQPPCSCCPQCLKGDGEKCGTKIGYCSTGFYCKGHIVHNHKSVDGRCSPVMASLCFKKLNCSTYICPPLKKEKCLHGIGRSPCGCCDVCLQAPLKPCGNRHGKWPPCGSTSTCRGEMIDQGFYHPGKCIPNMDKCPKRVRCPYLLPASEKCSLGQRKAPCACWLRCVKDEGQTCGWIDGVCHKAFYCHGHKYHKGKFTHGICKRIMPRKCHRKLNCDFVVCPRPPRRYRCLYGLGRSSCGCCDKCLRGPEESCGNYHGDFTPCGYEYECKGESTKAGEYAPGKCKKRSTCPQPVNCHAAKCKMVKNCRFGIKRPICSCCPSCRKGTGDSCGVKHGVCRKGDLCVGQYLWGTIYIPGHCLRVIKRTMYSQYRSLYYPKNKFFRHFYRYGPKHGTHYQLRHSRRNHFKRTHRTLGHAHIKHHPPRHNKYAGQHSYHNAHHKYHPSKNRYRTYHYGHRPLQKHSYWAQYHRRHHQPVHDHNRRHGHEHYPNGQQPQPYYVRHYGGKHRRSSIDHDHHNYGTPRHEHPSLGVRRRHPAPRSDIRHDTHPYRKRHYYPMPWMYKHHLPPPTKHT